MSGTHLRVAVPPAIACCRRTGDTIAWMGVGAELVLKALCALMLVVADSPYKLVVWLDRTTLANARVVLPEMVTGIEMPKATSA